MFDQALKDGGCERTEAHTDMANLYWPPVFPLHISVVQKSRNPGDLVACLGGGAVGSSRNAAAPPPGDLGKCNLPPLLPPLLTYYYEKLEIDTKAVRNVVMNSKTPIILLHQL